MLTMYHAPRSRSSRLVGLLHAMGIADQVAIEVVDIRRHDGSGAPDPANPHPEGKVPFLVDDGVEIWESSAIVAHLSEAFPDSPLSIPPGHPLRGEFLAWISWYGSVMEPVLLFEGVGIAHPALASTFRGAPEINARLSKALARGPWIIGDHYTGLDLLLSSPYHFYADATPDIPAIRDWVARCKDQPWQATMDAFDTEKMARRAA